MEGCHVVKCDTLRLQSQIFVHAQNMLLASKRRLPFIVFAAWLPFMIEVLMKMNNI